MSASEPEGPARPAPRVLRVFFDWGHRWPLWESGSDKYAMEPTDYGYSPALVEVLRQWQQAWMPIADFDMGETDQQPSSEAYQWYEDLARAGVAGILAETPAEVAVSLERDDIPRPDVPPPPATGAQSRSAGSPPQGGADTDRRPCSRPY